MNTKTIAFKDTSLDVDMEKYLSKHDVVYLTPAAEGYEGFPIGNGDMGAMAWTPADRIHFQINKCDTWDDAPDRSFGAWDDGNLAEAYTALRHCGELEIEPGLPMFDWMYLRDFNARLSLADAKATWVAKSPLGQIRCEAFVAHDPKVLVIKYEDELSEAVTRRVRLARWGSRVFEHWYAVIKRNGLMGPEGTQSGCEGDEVWIEQQTRSLKFAMVCKLVGEEATVKIQHSREAGFELNTGNKCQFTLYLAVVTSEEADDPLAAARQIVREAAQEGEEKTFRLHKQYWTDFWSKSFIDLSNDYLTNLWYMNVYQVGSSSHGKYPPHFVGGLWSWHRDFRPWNHFYHWNQQEYTWPLHASGHPDLMLPYAKWRLEGLPRAVEDARKTHNCSGAFYSDIANRRGYQDVVAPQDYHPTGDTEWLKRYTVLVNYNICPGAQIAGDLWRHYQYTLDEQFLRQYVYPLLREIVRFYLDYLKKEDDGLYHVPKATPYESSYFHCKDTTNNLAYIKWLFPAFVQVAGKLGKNEKLSDRATEVLNNLVEFVHTEIPESARIEKPVMETTDDILPGTPIMSCGVALHSGKPGHIWSKGPEGQKVGCHISNTQLSPVFPTGLVGLDQKGTEEFTVMENTLRCFYRGMYGWDMTPICQARMGLSHQLESVLEKWPGHHQHFPQGLFSNFRTGKDYEELFEKGICWESYSPCEHLSLSTTNRVKILGSSPEEYVELPTRAFAHMYLEPGSVLETTINEMLLQSYSGKIRVFPAIPGGWAGTFKLHAVGGFIVTSECKNSEILYIAIESKAGKTCRVINPWEEKEPVRVRDLTEDKDVCSGEYGEIEFDTRNGHVYLVERIGNPISDLEHKKITGEQNQKPKQSGRAILGKLKQF